ncbi:MULTISPECIES: hypothetical protein [unclassified Rhizobium]|uniref:DUF6894 family protein n=1 Tax=unclassified Rhizobium TaxID=2613769 RepID=UPI00071386D7|nr:MULTISPECIES: hypothetical protein [unclassified Rhizobium]KQT04711.1 hypothetical protein ASG50_15710 [Rhizobium sp. Leaf386]KQT05077.1 hypothetical protein ASG42_21360 [Rhizobium sp. Leaf391]
MPPLQRTGDWPRFGGVSFGEVRTVPLYYYRVRCTDEVHEEDEGYEFPNLTSAVADAKLALSDMIREAIDLNISLDIIALDVLDWNDKVVATIPIEDALNGYPMKH